MEQQIFSCSAFILVFYGFLSNAFWSNAENLSARNKQTHNNWFSGVLIFRSWKYFVDCFLCLECYWNCGKSFLVGDVMNLKIEQNEHKIFRGELEGGGYFNNLQFSTYIDLMLAQIHIPHAHKAFASN